MLHDVAALALALVLAGAALAKLRSPAATRAALTTIAGRWATAWPVLVALELALAVAVGLGADVAALVAAGLMLAGAIALARALRAGRAGAPCGCFGARSRVSRLAVVRNVALAAGFATLPLLPRGPLATDTWLTIGFAVALLGVAVLSVCVAALAREVGLLRLALGPQAALEVPEEGPALGTDSGLAPWLDPRPGPDLALAVFSSDGCRLCQTLRPQLAALARDPHVEVLLLDEVSDAEHWRRLDVPGSPYAVALGRDGTVLAKGTFNSMGQLESVLATAERRLPASA